jgi:hypothetical protein
MSQAGGCCQLQHRQAGILILLLQDEPANQQARPVLQLQMRPEQEKGSQSKQPRNPESPACSVQEIHMANETSGGEHTTMPGKICRVTAS